MAVSQKEIARHLGVSQALVGMALNDHPRISSSTRERVLNAAQQLGYDANLNQGARQMAARRHGVTISYDVIAVCTRPGRSSLHQQPAESEILDGIETAAERSGVDVLLCRLHSDRLPRLIEKEEVDGVIMLTGYAQQLKRVRQGSTPVVHMGSAIPLCHSVSTQSYQGILQATEHLINLGHRQIAFIGHDVNVGYEESIVLDTAKQRLAGFHDAMRKAGLPVEYVDSSLEESYLEYGARAFEALWEKSDASITGLVCYNDRLAMGAIQSAQKIGLKIPTDLSVVGFDDVSFNYGFEPRITSVRYDRFQMGVRAVEILMQVREGKDGEGAPYIQEELPVEFVEGVTTAQPKTRSSS